MTPNQSWNRPFVEVRAGSSRIAFLMFAITAILFGGVVVVSMFSSEMRWVALIIAGGPAAACAGAAALIRRRAGRRWIAVHPEGVSETAAGQTRAMGFGEIEEIRVRGWQLYTGAVAGGLVGAVTKAAVAGASRLAREQSLPYDATALTITLVGRGQQIQFCKWDADWVKAYYAIRAGVEPRLLEAARGAVLRGGAASFGPVQLTGQGLVLGKKTVAIADLERIDLTWSHMIVKQRGKLLPAGNIRLSKVPNLHVLLDLIDELLAATGARAAAA